MKKGTPLDYEPGDHEGSIFSTQLYLLICLFYDPMCADYIFNGTQPFPELQRCL